MERLNVVVQLVKYFWSKRKFWLIPFIVVFVLMGLLVVVSQSSVVGSFIYTLF
ncbi:MAG: hypothetical protein IPP71_03760 [Bacteroidetes bacterium]|nr:hypothetical protein [Bacteroidota bacterium]